MSEDTQMRNEFERAAYGQVKALESERDALQCKLPLQTAEIFKLREEVDRLKAELEEMHCARDFWEVKAEKLAEALKHIAKEGCVAVTVLGELRDVLCVKTAKQALAEFEKEK